MACRSVCLFLAAVQCHWAQGFIRHAPVLRVQAGQPTCRDVLVLSAKKGGVKGAAEEAMMALAALEEGGSSGMATLDSPDPQMSTKGKKGKKNAASAAAAALKAMDDVEKDGAPGKRKKKAKKGSAAEAAAAALEAIERLDEAAKNVAETKSEAVDKSGDGGATPEAISPGSLDYVDVVNTPRKSKKGKKGGAAGAAAAALEAIEGLDIVENDSAPAMSKKKRKRASATDSAVVAMKVAEDVADGDDFDVQAKGKKGRKGTAVGSALDGMNAIDSLVDDDPTRNSDGAAGFAAAAPEAMNIIEEAQARSEGKSANNQPRVPKLGEASGLDDEPAVEMTKILEDEVVSPAATDTFEAEILEVKEGSGREQGETTLEQKRKRERSAARVRVVERSGTGQASMRMEKVSVVFKNTEVLRDATWGVRRGDRVGVVGANGGGKSTQLKILAGELEPTTGEITMSSDKLKVAFLRQEFAESLDNAKTLKEELASVFAEEAEMLQSISQLEHELQSAEDDEQRLRVLEKLGTLQDLANKKGAYAVEAKVERIAMQMGFADTDVDALVASFSGGWKMRIGLAKVLLEQPDVWLLDEPTNHLDLESVEWLEALLREQAVAMVIVSHDR